MSERRNFTRKSGFRDSRLIIIATEGKKTEVIYFNGLKEYYNNPKIHVEVLERSVSASDPATVLKMLDQFRSKYNLRKSNDQLWLTIDVDRWGSQKLSSISQQCIQKQYYLAVSNPAFEIWLIMHIHALNTYTRDVQVELLENKKEGNRSRLEIELVNLLGSYNKTNPNMQFFNQHVIEAIQNARSADAHPEQRWTNELGTKVYLLAEEIINPH